MKYLLLIPALLVLLLLIAVVRTLLMPNKRSDYAAPEADARAMLLAQKLSKMIQYDTTSHANVHEEEKFLGFHKVLEELFPLVHEKLERTVIDGNLLYYWKGKSSEKPILLMSHQDVVPAEGEWLHEPFSGDIADGKVWGRGASDTKCSVMAFFEAVEELLREGGHACSCGRTHTTGLKFLCVGKGAVVKDCILMQSVEVQDGAQLSHVISDKNAFIKRDRRIVGQESYPVVIEKNAVI